MIDDTKVTIAGVEYDLNIATVITINLDNKKVMVYNKLTNVYLSYLAKLERNPKNTSIIENINNIILRLNILKNDMPEYFV